MEQVAKGSCNCSAIKWEVNGKLRDIVACHCSQCRKQSGLYYAATAADDADLKIIESGALKWYQSSPQAKRGFCSECGSALFWKHDTDDFTSILAGSIDGEIDVRIGKHICVEDKPDWYEIEDGKPQFQTF